MEEIIDILRNNGYSYECSFVTNVENRERFLDIKVYYIDDIIYESKCEVNSNVRYEDVFIETSLSHSRDNKINEILWKR